MMGLFRWPNRSRIKGVTYTFRLAAIQGEVVTPLERRTYPLTVIVQKGQTPERIRAAIQLRAQQIGHDMAKIIAAEVLAAVDEELRGK